MKLITLSGLSVSLFVGGLCSSPTSFFAAEHQSKSATKPADLGAPTIPVGEDAYLQWERWPYQRLGARAYMRSTYDRRGGNESADASHFLYQLATNDNVTLDVAGNGILYFARYNHWHGSPWRYVVDGSEHIIQESSSADPLKPVAGSVFMPEHLFPQPLAWTWSTTKGADLSWVPIPFERTFRMGYSRTRYGTGYYIYHLYDPSANLSRPIRSWDTNTQPNKAVLDLIARAGTDISPANATEVAGTIRAMRRSETTLITHLTNAPASIRSAFLFLNRRLFSLGVRGCALPGMTALTPALMRQWLSFLEQGRSTIGTAGNISSKLCRHTFVTLTDG